MEGEINRGIKVWLTIFISLSYCYAIGKLTLKGTIRLLCVLPIVVLFLLLPLNLYSIHIGGLTGFFIAWLANFKLLLFAFGKGPLCTHSSISLPRFVAIGCLPIKIQQNEYQVLKSDSFSKSHPIGQDEGISSLKLFINDHKNENHPFPKSHQFGQKDEISSLDFSLNDQNNGNPFPKSYPIGQNEGISSSSLPINDQNNENPFPKSHLISQNHEIPCPNPPINHQNKENPFPKSHPIAQNEGNSPPNLPKNDQNKENPCPELHKYDQTKKIQTSNSHTNYANRKNPIPQKHRKGYESTFNYATKIILLAMLLRVYDYSDYIHPKILLLLYSFHIYFCLEIILAIIATLARTILDLQLEPQFDEPHLSTSLQDFWGKRWNLMVTSILRPTVYNPILHISTRVMGRKWAPLPAVFGTFFVSGVMHELILYYLGREMPTWEMTGFFLLHGFCLMVEIGLKKMAVIGDWRLPRVVSVVMTIGFVVGSGFWLFLPLLLRCKVDVRGFGEYEAAGAFVKNAGRRVFYLVSFN